MLIRAEVTNFRSISDPVELSLVAVDADRDAARPAANLGESLLTVAAIFGPNASGKSNVIAALTWLRDAVRESLRFWEDGIPVEPFAFSSGKDRPTEFAIEFVIDEVRFEYLLELDAEAIRYEALFHYPERKRRRVFEREEGALKLQRGLGHLSGTRELLTPRTLVLSAARRFDESLVSGFANELLAGQTLGLRRRRRGGVFLMGGGLPGSMRSTMRWFEPDPSQLSLLDPNADSPHADRERALALLRLADLGIDDVSIEERDTSAGDGSRGVRTIELVHRADGERVQFEFGLESQGTRTWFELIGPVLTALKRGSLVLFDELDASLHPTLSAQLIRLFQEPTTNPAGAQLVFTSHDTSLLNHLNRDEIWLTEKSADGATHLGALAEFAGERVRRSQNLERAYLHGRFGALPDVDRTEMLRALGLIG